MKPKRPMIVEARQVTLDPMDLRRAISAAANAAQILTAALENTKSDERGRLKGAADECIAGLAALAFAQIPREERKS